MRYTPAFSATFRPFGERCATIALRGINDAQWPRPQAQQARPDRVRRRLVDRLIEQPAAVVVDLVRDELVGPRAPPVDGHDGEPAPSRFTNEAKA